MKLIDNIKQRHSARIEKRDSKRKKRGYKKISKFKVVIFATLFVYMMYFVSTEVYYIQAYLILLENEYNATGLTSPIIFNAGVIIFFILSFAFRHSQKEYYKRFAWYMELCMCMIILTYAMFQPSNFFETLLQGLQSMAIPLVLGVLLALDEPKWVKRLTSKVKQKLRSTSLAKRLERNKKKRKKQNEKPKGNATKKRQNAKNTKGKKGKKTKVKKTVA